MYEMSFTMTIVRKDESCEKTEPYLSMHNMWCVREEDAIRLGNFSTFDSL